MARKVENIKSAYGIKVKGTMCENYTCRRCGRKATICNYVFDKPVQIFVPHEGTCAAYNDDNPYSSRYGRLSNTCPTCRYEGPDSTCLYDEMISEEEENEQ